MLFICRKICKHCRCGPEDHDLTDEDDRERQPAKQLLENHYDNVRDLSSRLHKLNIDDPAVQSEIVTPENDIIIHRIIAENLVSRTYCKFGYFRKNLIFAYSFEIHICDVKKSRLGHNLPISVIDREISSFREGLIFTKIS